MIHDLPALCRQIRRDILSMTHAAGSGHPGAPCRRWRFWSVSISARCAWTPPAPTTPTGTGSCCPRATPPPAVQRAGPPGGGFDPALLPTLRQLAPPAGPSPYGQAPPGLDCSSGSLGQGLSIANGLALPPGAPPDLPTYCLLGTGSSRRARCGEAAMTAAHFALDTVCAIVDDNGVQLDASHL